MTVSEAERKGCFCYILECADGTFYTGWTTDPERRVKQHNKGVGARYTKTRCPVKLVYLEEQPDKVTALKRELAIKKMKRGQKLRLIEYPPDRQSVKSGK